MDWLIVASPRGEQIAGVPRTLERFPPANVLWAGLPSPSRVSGFVAARGYSRGFRRFEIGQNDRRYQRAAAG